MSRTSYVAAVDRVLQPMGFERDGRAWVRRVGSIEEHVELQWSQFAGTTANLWSEDLATEELLQKAAPWLQPAKLVGSATRIGYLTSQYDRWWKNDANGPAEIAAILQAHAPAFFESRRPLEAQARLSGRGSSRLGVASRIKLALILYRMGEIEEACQVVAEPAPKRTPENWVRELDSVRGWLLEQRASVSRSK